MYVFFDALSSTITITMYPPCQL